LGAELEITVTVIKRPFAIPVNVEPRAGSVPHNHMAGVPERAGSAMCGTDPGPVEMMQHLAFPGAIRTADEAPPVNGNRSRSCRRNC